MKKILVISGPTATGKSDLAILLARKFQAEVVNFDSLLFYNELNIGTAKPTQEELQQVPHHLINIVSAKKALNAADYVEKALPIVQDIHQRGKPVILVGGSGFYLQALLNGMYESLPGAEKAVERSDELYASEGIEAFINILKSVDPESLERIHQNDHYRLRRAVEYYWINQKKISEQRNETLNFWEKMGWDVLHIYLDLPREYHNTLIEKRTLKMFQAGLMNEVQTLLTQGFTGEEKTLQSIGYKETIQQLRGEFNSTEEYLERISISTRQLAKAQRTWFKKKNKMAYHPLTDLEKIISTIEEFLSR
ncbi:MAG: tRNA (adenosine(37)-N6)-dimethylallyltransferase MiaA [Bacteriovoracaceae bacterium]|nr:tRNA (adenosine(37)-N6)-dimethylallyltransferase MiaA [Bacteriovoracaceae bacterium]